ncbi:GAF domain-containing protein [Pseudanabaena sp. FACHB-1998]|uniref:methyl-accepting chemotaxis protein n=1 Tax=Pseudanabaena sp. FACHB-1998 TaxID=2692858 RepID=UPI0016818D56|nr:methyl-accepting chemotaxis protein [Pseudanabaena sp. FACHB-1998]MBD2176397.1 GAF domain-containing protein [Pseudanabaena sp. FACHB-1998]
MVLDSRSRVDSPEALNGNGKNPVINGTSNLVKNDINLTKEAFTKATEAELIPLSSKSRQNPMGRWWQSLGLRAKTTIVSVTAITIPLLILGGFTYVYVGQNIANSTRQAKSLRAEGMAYRTAFFMRERYGDIQTLANLPIFTNPKLQNSLTLAEQKAILDNYLKSYLVYDSIALYRLDGSLILDASTEPAPANASKRAYFQEVLKTDKAVISQPEPSVVTKNISVFIAAPVKDVTTGKTIAIIRTRLQASVIENLIKDFSVGGERYHIAESDGKFFVALEKEQLGRNLRTDFAGLLPNIEKRQLGSTTTIDQVSQAEEFTGYSPLPRIDGLPDLRWDAVVAVNTDIALKPLQQLLLILVGATGTLGILAAVLAIAIAQRATRPLIEATAAVVELGKGNLEARLAVQGQDEMSQLGSNINLMAGQLQRFLALQESEVKLSEVRSDISRLQSYEGLNPLLLNYLDSVRAVLQCDRAVIYEFDAEFAGRITRESVGSGLTSAFDAELSDPCIPYSIIENYKQGRTVATSDVLNAGFAPKHLDLMYKLQIKSNLVVPIRQADSLYGLLIVHKCQHTHVWQEDEIAYLKKAGEQLGVAFNGLQLTIEKQNTAEQERARSEAIQRELITLLSDVEGATSGDLTVRAQISAGEIGIVADFFNAIVESLREVVTKVKQATLQVNTSVNTNNESIRGLAEEATLQAEQLDEALKSVEQMTHSIQQVALSAQEAAEASSTAASTAEMGSEEIEQSVQSILQLRQTVDDTATKVKRLGEASKQISKVVVLIDQIALKTNMLALNASVEAARAGEEGRGFAVVATEVGSLAAQSANATREIGRLVESIQQETNEVVQAMQASTVQVIEGTNRVADARKSLNQIVEVSRKVNTLFQEISLATSSQVQISESVRSLMSNLSNQSQRSSETSRDVANSLQQTASVASQLQSSVETFKVD